MPKTKDFDLDILDTATQEFDIAIEDNQKNISTREDKADPNDPAANNISWLSPADISISDSFSKMFRINNKEYELILSDMKENGFREDKPVIIWTEKNHLIDGHTRLKAAKELKVKVAAIYKSFHSQKEAVSFAMKEQCNRRNLSDSDRFWTLQNCPFITSSKNKKQTIADLLGVGTTTAAKYLKVLAADSGMHSKIENGLISINHAYKILEKEEKYNPNRYKQEIETDKVQVFTVDAGKTDPAAHESGVLSHESIPAGEEENTPGHADAGVPVIDDFLDKLKEKYAIGEKSVSIEYIFSFFGKTI